MLNKEINQLRNQIEAHKKSILKAVKEETFVSNHEIKEMFVTNTLGVHVYFKKPEFISVLIADMERLGFKVSSVSFEKKYITFDPISELTLEDLSALITRQNTDDLVTLRDNLNKMLKGL